jgi:hypothetical protein
MSRLYMTVDVNFCTSIFVVLSNVIFKCYCIYFSFVMLNLKYVVLNIKMNR